MRTIIAVAVAAVALAATPALADGEGCGWKNQSAQTTKSGADTAQLPQTPRPNTDKPAG